MSFNKILMIFLYVICGIATADTQDYTIDPLHTNVTWRISHFGFSHPSGKWMAESGVLSLDEKKLTNSSVSVTIQIDDLQTGIQKLDEHLLSNQFFDAAKFPNAVFVSTKIQQKGANKLSVIGNLTIHGVTKQVTLNTMINKIGMSPISLHKTVGFSATTQIKRSDFGMKAYLPGLGDNVDIAVEGEAILPSASDNRQGRNPG